MASARIVSKGRNAKRAKTIESIAREGAAGGRDLNGDNMRLDGLINVIGGSQGLRDPNALVLLS